MNKLIINTANDELFIVLKKGNKVFSKSLNAKMHHNETMIPIIDELLSENNLKINNIDEFGVVLGPGSFTGIRVGIATIKAFRDAVNVKARGINNLDYLFSLAKRKNKEIETVAIAGSRDSFFVAKQVFDVVYKYERNLTQSELEYVADNKPIGMFKSDENLNCFILEQDAEVLLNCLEESSDEKLVPIYYQLSQAENEKLKRTEVKIEEAKIKDLKHIFDLEKQCILVNAMSESQIETAINDSNYIVLKAVVENDIVGFVIVQKSDEYNIDSIAVEKEFRNWGVATKLIDKVHNIAKDNKVNVLSLEVSDKNITAYLLYKKIGFEQRRIRKKYYEDGSNAIEMIKCV